MKETKSYLIRSSSGGGGEKKYVEERKKERKKEWKVVGMNWNEEGMY